MTARNESKTISQLSALTFGIEIETQTISRRRAVEVIAAVVGGTACDAYDYSQTCTDSQGRTWKAVRDGSIGNGAEVVSPILTYTDIPKLQEVVRALRRNGATVDSRCGIHIHVGAAALDAKGIGRLVSYWNRQEKILQAMFGGNSSRYLSHNQGGWAGDVDADFLARIENRRPATRDELANAWYGYSATSRARNHYDNSRYHGLNLHNVFSIGTVEFRTFDATLHAGKIRAYVQFCLAMVAKAKNGRWSQRSQNARRDFNPTTAKYDARTIMLRLNLSGDEFKTCRLHLTQHLAGTASTANTNGRRDRRDHQARQAAAQVAPVANVANL